MENQIAVAKQLVAYIREEADYNRSWTDGRHPEISTTSEYVARRLALARQRDLWADAVDALIAAAPGLLEACQLLLSKAFMRKFDGDEKCHRVLLAAIAKAAK